MRSHSTNSYNQLLKKLAKKPVTRKDEYSKLLLDPRWKAKRAEIIARDKDCQLCMGTTRLHVHHKQYLPNRSPWEYENSYLIVLCENCHRKFHKKATFKKPTKDGKRTTAVRK